MAKNGKQKGATAKPEKDVPRIAPLIAANTIKLLEYAKSHEGFADRSSPHLLEDYIERQGHGERVGKSSIYRMIEGKRAVGADVLDVVARAFGLDPWHLLFPAFDPARLPPGLLRSSDTQAMKVAQQVYGDAVKAAQSVSKKYLASATGEKREQVDPQRDSKTDGARSRRKSNTKSKARN